VKIVYYINFLLHFETFKHSTKHSKLGAVLVGLNKNPTVETI